VINKILDWFRGTPHPATAILSDDPSANYIVFLDMDGVLVDMTKLTVKIINENLAMLRDGTPVEEIHPRPSEPTYKRTSSLYLNARKQLEKLAALMEEAGEETITYARFEHLTFLKDTDALRSGLELQVGEYFLSMATGNRDFWMNMEALPNAQKLVDMGNLVSDASGGVRILSAPLDNIVVKAKRDWVKENLKNVQPENVFIERDKGKFLSDYEMPAGTVPILIDDREKYRSAFESSGGKTIPYNPQKVRKSFKLAKSILKKIISR